jgi:hypothetical protein
MYLYFILLLLKKLIFVKKKKKKQKTKNVACQVLLLSDFGVTAFFLVALLSHSGLPMH